MQEVIITIRDNGPLLVRGPFKLLDVDGNELTLDTTKPNCALCRCGASKIKPFCDGSHRDCHFESVIRAAK